MYDARVCPHHGLHTKPLDVIKKCQKLVTTTKESRKMKHWVHLREHSPKHKKMTWLLQAATTRFSSTYNCMYSVLLMKQALKNMLEKRKPETVGRQGRQGTAGQNQVVAIMEDKKFWRDLEIYTPLAEPYNQVYAKPAIKALL